MNCSVSAGPATARPGVRAVGPQMKALRMPIFASVLLAVAAPISGWPPPTRGRPHDVLCDDHVDACLLEKPGRFLRPGA